MKLTDKKLIVFMKSPEPGKCKTRLMPFLSAEQASEFYKTLIIKCLDNLKNLSDIDISLYIYPDTKHPFFQTLDTPFRVSLRQQQGSNLGDKMYHAIDCALTTHNKCVLIGSDCPTLDANYINKAFKALDQHDIVMGPAEDGGYVLIAATKISHSLFENISWGTDSVLQKSLANINAAGYHSHLLKPLRDIDTPEDYLHFQSQINHPHNARETMDNKQADDIRNKVRDSYSKVAEADNAGDSCGVASSCCGVSDDDNINQLISTRMGYSEADLINVPAGADMGLGCGNPKALAALQAGEVVVDLGSGGGFDAFLAANEVGKTGKVIGVDMTPEMISKARANAEKANYTNVEFRLGEIEHLPVADNSVDTIMSNCVINLSPNKQQVFNDAYRILKSGGRLAISDIVSSVELPEEIKTNTQLYSACISGASSVNQLTAMMEQAGFKNIKIQPKDESRDFIKDWVPGIQIEDYVVSASIQATK